MHVHTVTEVLSSMDNTQLPGILILLDKATEVVFSCKLGDKPFLPCGSKEKAKQDACF